MPPHTADGTPAGTTDSAQLKRLVSGIIRSQGNRFVKELLRTKKIRIGENKAEFEQNLSTAIDQGKLTLTDFQQWLKEVEGWGNQHVYLYKIAPTLARELTRPKIEARVNAASLSRLWNVDTTLVFPDEPELTSISFEDRILRLVWQEAFPDWTPEPEKDYEKVEGLDTYMYKAFRKTERRAVTRFEAHLDKGLAALFIPNPIDVKKHKESIHDAKEIIAKLFDLTVLERGQIDIAILSCNIDQRNVPTSGNLNPEIRTQKSKLASGGAYVEFAANSIEKAYWEESAIHRVRQTVRNQQLPDFRGLEGSFIFGTTGNGGLERPLRVQLYGNDKRIRLWAQMEATEVWTILIKLSQYV